MPHSEEPAITCHHEVYPGIDVGGRLKDAARGKVVYITGASKGVGEATARAYAKANCEALFLTARSESLLKSLAASITSLSPEVRVEVYTLDVTDEAEVGRSIERCVQAFGRIDVVIANAGYMEKWTKIGDIKPTEWWRTWEVNIRGTFNVVHHAIHHLIETKGYIILISSKGAQGRYLGASGYQSGKHAINRFAEFIYTCTEYSDQGIKVFSVHPGDILTELSSVEPTIRSILNDDVNISGNAMVRLTSGSEDWLSGRYVSCSWDLDELNERRKEIEEQDLLKNRLDIGSLAKRYRPEIGNRFDFLPFLYSFRVEEQPAFVDAYN